MWQGIKGLKWLVTSYKAIVPVIRRRENSYLAVEINDTFRRRDGQNLGFQVAFPRHVHVTEPQVT